MNIFVIASLAALSGSLAGIAIGAQLSRVYGPAPSDTPAAFTVASVFALVATVATAILL